MDPHPPSARMFITAWGEFELTKDIEMRAWRLAHKYGRSNYLQDLGRWLHEKRQGMAML